MVRNGGRHIQDFFILFFKPDNLTIHKGVKHLNRECGEEMNKQTKNQKQPLTAVLILHYKFFNLESHTGNALP